MKKDDKKKKVGIVIAIIILVFVAFCILGYMVVARPMIAETIKYNEAVATYNETADKYADMLTKTSVDNIEDFAVEIEKLEPVSENKMDIIKSALNGNNTEKIESDIESLSTLSSELQAAIDVMKQITKPTDEWITERLSNVDGITEITSVTEERDPNQMLNKEGGYIGCIYFSHSAIDQSTIAGEDLIAKGTAAGGAIEVYKTVKDAEERCEYLAGFDDTILYSGSYALVGTMVVRTSYLFDEQDQYTLTNMIVTEFTRL